MAWHSDMPPEYRNAIVTGDARLLAERLPDESVDLVLTDPPYGCEVDFRNGVGDAVATARELAAWTRAAVDRILRPGGYAVVFQDQATAALRETLPLFPEDARLFAGCKTWTPIHFGMLRYAFDVAVCWRKKGKPLGRGCPNWFAGNTADTNGRNRWDRPRHHGCPKPLDTISYLVEGLSYPGGVVADFFAGTGTTCVAARLLGRNFVAFEIDPETAALARERVRLTPEPLLVLDTPDPQETLAL